MLHYKKIVLISVLLQFATGAVLLKHNATANTTNIELSNKTDDNHPGKQMGSQILTTVLRVKRAEQIKHAITETRHEAAQLKQTAGLLDHLLPKEPSADVQQFERRSRMIEVDDYEDLKNLAINHNSVKTTTSDKPRYIAEADVKPLKLIPRNADYDYYQDSQDNSYDSDDSENKLISDYDISPIGLSNDSSNEDKNDTADTPEDVYEDEMDSDLIRRQHKNRNSYYEFVKYAMEKHGIDLYSEYDS